MGAFRQGLAAACVIGFFACTSPAPGFGRDEKPDWVRTFGKTDAFPPSTYVTGFGMSASDASMSAADKLAYARNMALSELVKVLQVNISSENLVNQFSTMVKGREELVDEYRSRVVARSEMSLDGVQYQEYSAGGRSDPTYALAYLEKEPARVRCRNRFKEKIQRLVTVQTEGNRQLAAREIAAARNTFLECDRLVSEIEQTVMMLDLLGVPKAMTDEDLKTVLDVKQKSRDLWKAAAGSLEEAAELLAMKLAAQKPPKGKLQVNALMLEDWYQYSQFSARFRTDLEHKVGEKTGLRPLDMEKADFTPGSAGKFRAGLAAGADYVLTGNYFLKPNTNQPEFVHCYVRVLDAKTSATVASADARLTMAAVGSLELKPRNFLQMLEDQRVFNRDEFVGGGLNLEVWTSRGAENLIFEDGEDIKIFVRVNKPAYVRFIYHLNNGARIVPDPRFVNFHVPEDRVNKVVELPAEFTICPPFGAETMQFFAYSQEEPGLATQKKTIEGQPYDVVVDGRGIRMKIQAPEKAERRITVTTIPKTK
jgi:hypothetical protein